MRARIALAATWIVACAAVGTTATISTTRETFAWHTEYAAAYHAASAQGKMLFVFFNGQDEVSRHFKDHILTDESIEDRLRGFVCLELPLDATASVDGHPVRLIEQAAFAPLQGKAGIGVVDLAHRDAPYYGGVVSMLPFSEKQCYSKRQMAIILDLPAGTFAQRYAALEARLSSNVKAASSTSALEAPTALPAIDWMEDYGEATEKANREGKMLLIFFCNADQDALCREFAERAWSNADVLAKLADYVCLRISPDAQITIDGQPQTVLKQEAFREMLGRPGVAIVDYANAGENHFATVVSVFPLTQSLRYTPQQVVTMLTLPPGTLTQRTLIFAVKTHPERPASANGDLLPRLREEAESHSNYQAAIRRQGHHRWETRFHRVNAQLPAGLTASEVCAESWPGQNLVEAAIECVRCWRSSSGHWRAVRTPQNCYGYDMKRGGNGVWYATGVFGGR
jgi:hypothetical protein